MYIYLLVHGDTFNEECYTKSEVVTVKGNLSDSIRLSEIPSKNVKSGNLASFTCELLGGGSAEFAWIRNGQLLRSGGRLKIFADEETSVLKISNVQPNDRGSYICVAKNPISEARTIANLTVEGGT